MAILWMTSSIAGQPFITRWNLSTAGSGPTQLTFGVGTTGPVSYTWETIPAAQSGAGTFSGTSATITGLPAGALIRLSIDSTHFARFVMNNGTDKNRLLDVEQWGGVHWTSMENAFHGCQNLNLTSADFPDLSATTSLSSMFQACASLNGPQNIGSWQTQNITNMASLFSGAFNFNQAIGTWNTQNVTNMTALFNFATSFNQPIGSWNTQNVTTMAVMFFGAADFNQPIDSWNIQNVTNLQQMFRQASQFNQPLNSWNTNAVTNMNSVFYAAQNFNQPLDNWNTQNVTNMNSMFFGAQAFNQPIGNWNVQNVSNMSSMFNGAISFNQPLGNWNTQSLNGVVSMFSGALSFNQPIGSWNMQNVSFLNSMFANAVSFNQPLDAWNTQNIQGMSNTFNGASSFNQPLGNWNTASVTNLQNMFSGATAFNQAIGNWNTSAVTNMSGMFTNAAAFNQPLNTWNTSSVTQMQNLFSGDTVFNQSIGNWSTGNVQNMSNMFRNASAFNQDVSAWNVLACSNLSGMFRQAVSFNHPVGTWTLQYSVNLTSIFDSCGMDCENYSHTLIGWNANPALPVNRNLGASGRIFGSSALGSRNNLLTAKGWTIIGDTTGNGPCCIPFFDTMSIDVCNSYAFNGQLLIYDGLYVDTFMNQYGCDSILTLNLTIKPVNTSMMQSGNTLTSLCQSGSWQWLKCNPWQLVAGQIGKDFSPTMDGEYAVVVTENGCTDTSACYTVSGLGLSHEYADALLSIYPNPVSGNLHIESLQGFRQASIRLLSVSGELVRECPDVNGSNFSLDLSQFANGLYYLEILAAEGKSIRKIIKQ